MARALKVRVKATLVQRVEKQKRIRMKSEVDEETEKMNRQRWEGRLRQRKRKQHADTKYINLVVRYLGCESLRRQRETKLVIIIKDIIRIGEVPNLQVKQSVTSCVQKMKAKRRRWKKNTERGFLPVTSVGKCPFFYFVQKEYGCTWTRRYGAPSEVRLPQPTCHILRKCCLKKRTELKEEESARVRRDVVPEPSSSALRQPVLQSRSVQTAAAQSTADSASTYFMDERKVWKNRNNRKKSHIVEANNEPYIMSDNFRLFVVTSQRMPLIAASLQSALIGRV